MSFIAYISIAVIVGLVVGTIAGPTIRLWVAQLITEAKAEYEKEKAFILADLQRTEDELNALKASSSKIIADLKADLSKAEAKVATFTSLFASVPQPSVVPAPAVPVTTDNSTKGLIS